VKAPVRFWYPAQMKNARLALKWLAEIFAKKQISWQVTGGLAAKIYGAKRPLADIDIEIHKKDFKKILHTVKKFIVFGPKKYKDDNWDIFLMTLKYKGQLFDISACDDASIFNHKLQKWSLEKSTLTKKRLKFWGLTLPVVSKKKLSIYKSKLGRPVDLIDLEQMK